MGRPKGLLRAPDSPLTLAERLLGEVRAALPQSTCYLVGERAEYAHMALPVLQDEAQGAGPLGGLVALLAAAVRAGAPGALVLACDLPYVEAPLLRRLAEECPEAELFCPRVDDRYQPLFARYQVAMLEPFREALSTRRLALQRLLAEHGAEELVLDEGEAQSLRDWDTPEDAGLPRD
jgi:molybdopterin-guanine dinucleotide biosynthesis protein A